LEDEDLIGFTFCGSLFQEMGPGWMNYKPAKEVKFEDIWNLLGFIFQSNANSMNTESRARTKA
jgi:hypothetical protein